MNDAFLSNDTNTNLHASLQVPGKEAVTSDATLDAAVASAHGPSRPGRWILLRKAWTGGL